MSCLLRSVLVICGLLILSVCAQLPKHCDFIKNISESDSIRFPDHKYVIVEECLYYNLSSRADDEQGKHNALITLPPTKAVGDHVKISIGKMTVQQLWLNEVWKEMNIAGYFDVLWQDYRLTWNTNKWKLKTLRIKSYGHIWVPDLYAGKDGTTARGNDFTVFKDIQVTDQGHITSRLQYRMQAVCKMDYYNFPSDARTCCFYLHSEYFGGTVDFDLKVKSGILDEEEGGTNWDVREITLKVEYTDDNETPLKVCVTAYRKTSTLRIELTIPMVISAILVLISPLFGSFKHQLWVKLFAILLQFMCFQFLVSKTPHLGFEESVPKIYRFYEFSVALTLLSLLVTLVLHALSRVPRSLPPPHRLSLVASTVNAYLCCSPEAKLDAEKETQHNTEWFQMFGCLNNLFSLVLMIVYILGVLVLCS